MDRESGRAYVDDESEIVKPGDKALRELCFVAPIEMIGAEITVVSVAREHVIGGREHRSGDREDGLLGSAATLDPKELGSEVRSFFRAADQAAWTSVVLSQGLLERMRVERRLPALSCRRGHSPAHDTRWAALGKRVMSKPISATITRATVSLTPGMMIR